MASSITLDHDDAGGSLGLEANLEQVMTAPRDIREIMISHACDSTLAPLPAHRAIGGPNAEHGRSSTGIQNFLK